jgi:photosystem II stability/assembly factor-like uncharacterized protein
MALDSALLQPLEWRCIGPHRGGRVVAVAGDPANPMTFYFGACNGGVWKTTDGGTYWENVSDGFFKTAAVGAIAVAASDPNVLYAGMGEACIRNDVSSGDGVYKSTDGGKTWQHMGLADSRHIGRVRVHPKDPDVVYVAALGHAWAPNEERGVFRSRDGGQIWEKVLYRSNKAGAVDLSMDPNNPRILYAAMWEAYRLPWSISSGGPDSSLYKSTDGGNTWTELTNHPGMPQGLKGRIGVAVSPAQPERVWAMVEAEQGGLYRSDDGGATWELVNDTDGRGRPWYHTHVFADPQNPETVWVMDGDLFKSVDGGRTFREVPAPHGDHHDLWIDPGNPQRMINGNDGGATVTFNGGRSWSTIYNQPTACFYHLAVDNQYPYRVCGTQQDNSAISVPSRSTKGYIPLSDCYMTGTSESGHIAVRPDNPNIVYSGAIGSSPGGGGNLLRSDHASGDSFEIITVWPEETWGWAPSDEKYRFHWTYPIVISPHNPNVLYVTGNLVFRSTNEGRSWEAISPDLTRNDPTRLEISGGPITVQGVSGAETYCTIFAFVESPHERGVFWAGSDDGLIHLSRDGGQTWENVTPPDLPEWATVALIEVSPHDPATSYVAAYRYKLDDYRPYLYKTNDYGKTWRTIASGIPEDDFTRVIREDPMRRGLLYAGTETGLYISFDDGVSWQRFRSNLPVVPIYDLAIKNDDLVVATHGRSFWILDDITPLRQLTPDVSEAPTHLFKPGRTYQDVTSLTFAVRAVPGVKNYQTGAGGGVAFYEKRRPDGSTYRSYQDAGDNPTRGVLVSYLLKEQPQGEVTLTFLDASGQEIRSFTRKKEGEETKREGVPKQQVPVEPGMNRFIWDMRYPAPTQLEDDPTIGAFRGPDQGPEAPPGPYQVRLTVNGQAYTETFEIAKDPRVAATREDLDERFALLIQIRDKLSETNEALLRLRSIRQQVEEWGKRADDRKAVAEAAQGLKEKLSAVEEELIQTRAKTRSDFLRYPAKLNAKIRALASVPASVLGTPTQQSYDVFQDLSARLNVQVKQLEGLIATEVAAFNEIVRQAGVPAVGPIAVPPVGQQTVS